VELADDISESVVDNRTADEENDNKEKQAARTEK
jgi:hypothetical protein